MVLVLLIQSNHFLSALLSTAFSIKPAAYTASDLLIEFLLLLPLNGKILFFLIGTVPLSLIAQEADTTQHVEELDEPSQPVKAKPNNQQKIFYVGNIGASFGNYTMVGIYPLVGYNLKLWW